jgi:ribosomal protein S18 acetylase RimI-like enzyme
MAISPHFVKYRRRVSGIDVPLIRRLEAVIDSFAVARLDAIVEGDNSFDLQVTRFGSSVAPTGPGEPELDFVNRVTLAPADVDRIDDILEHYRSLGLRPWLEPSPELRLALPRGFDVVGSQAVLYREASGADVRTTVRETDDAEGAASVLLRAFGVPPPEIGANAHPLAVATERCGGRFFVADDGGEPAAAAILTMHGGDGYLAMAGTLPAFRGRGHQTALIDARLASAAARGCGLVVATAAFPSTSHRNLERCGLRTAYTKPVLRLAV